MFQMVNDPVSNDNLTCQSFGIISTISNHLIPCLVSVNLAYSFAKQGFKVILLDLNLTQPSMGLLFNNKFFFNFTINKLFDENSTFDSVQSLLYTKKFETDGLLTIIPANIDMKSRIRNQNSNSSENKRDLAYLMDFIKELKNHYNFIIINMPNGSDLRHLTLSCLICDNNFLLIDQNNVSIGYGIDLIANLENIHPLIEFKGLILYDYKYNVNFINDDRPLLEQTFNLPVLATIPELPSFDLLILLESPTTNVPLNNYYKFLSQELHKYMVNPSLFVKNFHVKTAQIEVLIIANNAGMPLFTTYLKGNLTEKSTFLTQDEILASATLTAVVIGITEVIKELTQDLSGEINLIKQKHLNLVIERDYPLRAMMLSQRNEEAIRSKILVFLKLFKQKYKNEIDSFTGLSKIFKGAQSLVEEVF